MKVSVKKMLAYALPSLLLVLPALVYAQAEPIVPCGTEATNNAECTFSDLLVLLTRFISYFILFVYAPFISLVVMYIGFLFVRDKANAKTQAKKMLWNVVVGTFVVLGAWAIVNFVAVKFINTQLQSQLPVNN